MNARTRRFGELTWTEAQELVAENPVILLPIGVLEQHGPHLPLDEDNIVAEFVANRVAEQVDCLVLPTLNYGHSPIFRNYCGTISLSSETLRSCIVDIVSDLYRSGFRRFILVNNNGGNLPASGEAAFILHERFGIVLAELYPWGLGYGLMRDQYDNPDVEYGHGGEPEMSAMMAMYPERIVTERIPDGGLEPTTGGFTAANYTAFKVPGQAGGATIFWQWDSVCPTGASGATRIGTEERGQVWVDRVVSFCADAVREFDRATASEAWAQPGAAS
jgi:creatinine amidohydrolase